MKNRRNNKGFTLVELLIAVSILAIAVIPLMTNFVVSSKVNSKSKVTMNGTAVAQNIMEGINAYGVEQTIIQLEDDSAAAPVLKFMPSGTKVDNWGRCKFDLVALTDPSGNPVIDAYGQAVKKPDYDTDRYQDSDMGDIILMKRDGSGVGQKEDGVYKCTYVAGKETELAKDASGNEQREKNTAHSMAYAYKSDRDGKIYFKEGEGHAYMFWLKNVRYGSKTSEIYDVLLTMDANHYRDYTGTYLDTTMDVSVMDPSGDNQETIRTAITDGDAIAGGTGGTYADARNYNDTMMSRITTDIGTNAAVDDTTSDRYYMEPTNALSEAVQQFLFNKCNSTADRDKILRNLQRDIYINITQEANPSDLTMPYRIITVHYKYKLLDTSLLKSAADDSYEASTSVEIFRSCVNRPRNIFIYYLPNYEPFTYSGSLGKENIHIVNVAGDEIISGSGIYYGTDMNLFLIRQTAAAVSATQEANYKTTVELKENIKDFSTVKLKNLRTHIFTNIGYSLVDDEKSTATEHMGTYKLNGVGSTELEKKVGGLNGVNDAAAAGANEEDYIYDVTVQVFKAGYDYSKEARIAKFTGSSN